MARPGYRKCRTCERNRAERFFVGQRGRVCRDCRRARSRTSSRNRRILTTYNITAGEYEALLAAQDGKCAGCKQERQYLLPVDHCHKTLIVRGLLCKRCNGRVLPAVRDDPQILRWLADYLENPPALSVIGRRIVPEKAA